MFTKVAVFAIGILAGALLILGYDCNRAGRADRLPVRVVNNSGEACEVLGYVTTSGAEPHRSRVETAETATVYPWQEPVSVVQSELLLEIRSDRNRIVFELTPEELAAISDSTMPLTIELRPDGTFISSGDMLYENYTKE